MTQYLEMPGIQRMGGCFICIITVEKFCLLSPAAALVGVSIFGNEQKGSLSSSNVSYMDNPQKVCMEVGVYGSMGVGVFGSWYVKKF